MRKIKRNGDLRSLRITVGFICSLVHWFIESGNTRLNQDFLDLRIFRILSYPTDGEASAGFVNPVGAD